MKTNVIEKEFIELAEQVFNDRNISETQVIESRRMFYAGFHACLVFMTETIGEMSDEHQASELITGIMQEAADFFAGEMRRGEQQH